MTLTYGPVRVADTQSSEAWDAFVHGAANGTIYHDSAWLDVLARTYGFVPYRLTMEDARGELRGILPLFLVDSKITGRRLVSLPCTNAAGPLSQPGTDVSPLLVAALDIAQRQGCGYLEIRGQPDERLSDNVGLSQYDYFGTFLLDLDGDVAQTRARFDKRARRGIAKATKSGVTVRFGEDKGAIREFYRLNVETRRKHGVPPQPLAFFENLWDVFRPRGGVEVLLAEYEGQVVASIILLAYKQTVIYAYGASDQGYLKVAPNHALFDAAIAWSVANGHRSFDFGRTSPDNVGLMDFKRQWGASFHTLPYYHWPKAAGFVSESESSFKHKCFTAVWRRLPVAAARVLGPPLYRHLA